QADGSKTRQEHTYGSMPSRPCWTSRTMFPAMILAAAFVLTGTSARASDPIGVFAKIDKVVLEPNDTAPERIQLWGSFCLADDKDRDSYLAPQKGYLFYKLP